jgi:hypothetical protein
MSELAGAYESKTGSRAMYVRPQSKCTMYVIPRVLHGRVYAFFSIVNYVEKQYSAPLCYVFFP